MALRRALVIALLFLLMAAALNAQKPSVSLRGIVNHFSYAAPGLPNADIAQGSIFDIYGSNLGPKTLVQLSGFPIPKAIAGTSVRVTSGGQTVDVFLFFVFQNQIVGVLPSSTPVGTGTLTVTVNGQSSDPAPIRIVPRSLGILTLDQSGRGPAVMQIPDGKGNVPLNSVTTTIRPGQIGVFYGTGAGAVTFDETVGAPFLDLGSGFRVLVGGQEAKFAFKGRTPGLVGLDQFNVEIPQGVEGCYVSVAFFTGNVPSNYSTISVSKDGRACPDPIPPVPTSGIRRTGFVTFSRDEFLINSLTNTFDLFSAAFDATDFSKLPKFSDRVEIRIGSCIIGLYGGPPVPDASAAYSTLDAGTSLTVKGPNGTRLVSHQNFFYTTQLGSSDSPPLFLEPGTYSVDNGPGGKDVGPFVATFKANAPVLWTNRDQIASVDRAQGINVTWTGGDPDSDVHITGVSFQPESDTVSGDAGASFSCAAKARDGHFLVPPAVLLPLPPSVIALGFITGHLSVGSDPVSSTFSAPGVDSPIISFSALSTIDVPYR